MTLLLSVPSFNWEIRDICPDLLISHEEGLLSVVVFTRVLVKTSLQTWFYAHVLQKKLQRSQTTKTWWLRRQVLALEMTSGNFHVCSILTSKSANDMNKKKNTNRIKIQVYPSWPCIRSFLISNHRIHTLEDSLFLHVVVPPEICLNQDHEAAEKTNLMQ